MSPPRLTRKAAARTAFTLWELLFTLVVVGIAMNLAMRLVHLTVSIYGQTATASVELSSQRQWLEQMRRDVWACESRTVADNTLTLNGGQAIVWRQQDEALTRETADGEVRRWSTTNRQLRWSIGPAGLIELGDGAATITLASAANDNGGGR